MRSILTTYCYPGGTCDSVNAAYQEGKTLYQKYKMELLGRKFSANLELSKRKVDRVVARVHKYMTTGDVYLLKETQESLKEIGVHLSVVWEEMKGLSISRLDDIMGENMTLQETVEDEISEIRVFIQVKCKKNSENLVSASAGATSGVRNVTVNPHNSYGNGSAPRPEVNPLCVSQVFSASSSQSLHSMSFKFRWTLFL